MADFHIDHDVAIAVARHLGTYGHTAFTARDLGMAGAKDDEHLLAAAHTRRIVVTHNRRDFELLHLAWLHWSQAWFVPISHAGILAVDHHPADQLAREIHTFVSSRQVSGQPLTNELYRWRPQHGWTRY